MEPFNEIKQYCKTVCEQIRWKKAHQIISEEIENHLCDQRDAYISQGEDRKLATQKAIVQMGDAVSIGMALDKTHKPKPQWIMIALAAMLMLMGMLSRYLIDSSEYTLNQFNVTPYIIALAVFIVCYLLDLSILVKYAKYCYFIILAISIIGLLLGSPVHGRIHFFASKFSVSLSYLSLIFPLTYSLLIYSLRYKGYKGIVLCSVGYIPLALILLLVPSLTGFVLFTISALVMLYVAIIKGWFRINKRHGLLFVLIPALVVIFASLIHIIQNPYYINRLHAVINPYADRDGYGYTYYLVRNLLANAKFIGKGDIPAQFGNQVPSIPVFDTDYMLTMLTYHFGWIVFIGISIVMMAFSVLGIYYVTKQKSMLGMLVSLSIILTLTLQSTLYMINNLGYGILSSVSLPMFSYGKVALIIHSALIGFLLSAFRMGDILTDKIKRKNNAIVSYKDGKLTVNLNNQFNQ